MKGTIDGTHQVADLQGALAADQDGDTLVVTRVTGPSA